MSGLIEKIKDAVHGDKHHSSSNDPASAKGHDSHAANKADPRVDSDRDGRANPLSGNTAGHSTTTGHSSGAGMSGLGSGTHYTGTTGQTTGHTAGHTTGSNTLGSSTHTSSNTGPHSSNLANKADPRVDSDRDHRANPASGVGATGGEFGSSRTTGTNEFGSTTRSGAEYGNTGTTGGLGSSNTAYGNTSTNAGPHDSNLLNKADPRVDSDRDHRANPTSGGLGSNTGAYGTTGSHNTHGTSGLGSSNTYGTSTNTGPHDSNLLNKADPRVDSDRDHRANPTSGGLGSNTGAYGSSTTGTHTGTHTGAHTGSHTTGATGLNNPGPAPNTAGPHSKDILNKVDPRVDSDRDGSKTVGQDQTYARS